MKRMDQEKGHKTSGRIVGLLLALLMLVSVTIPMVEASAAEDLTELDTITAELDGVTVGETEEEETPAEEETAKSEIEGLTSEIDGVAAAATSVHIDNQSLEQGGSTTIRRGNNLSLSSYTVKNANGDVVTDTAGISVSSSSNALSLTAGYATEVGTYKVTVTWTERERGATREYTATFQVEVTSSPDIVNGKVKVYVYVGTQGTDSSGNTIYWYNNEEFLDLLGISKDTVDGYRYFPVGEIYLDASYFAGKEAAAATVGAALINSEEDWNTLLDALSALDTTTLTDKYAANQGNKVGDYLKQAAGDIDASMGSQKTALFRWNNTTSFGFVDQDVKYHLDLRFNTKTITFITGNNGITSGNAQDSTIVDYRTYITGSEIQKPRNLYIPDGYQFMGYYEDPDFTIPWDGIGTPLNEDQRVYIKITAIENVILYYEVAQGQGTVSPDNEALNPVTDVAQGSVATAAENYKFDGWYADKECTESLSKDAKYVPTKGVNEQWTSTTYYAKFVPTTADLTITKTFVGLDNVNKPAVTVTVKDDVGVVATVPLADTDEDNVYSAVVSGLEIGKTYTVTETAAEVTNYDLTGTTNVVDGTSGTGAEVTVTILADGSSVEYVNTYALKTASLTITKKFEGLGDNVDKPTVSFNVSGYNDTVTLDGEVDDIETASYVATIPGLSIGEYTVTEVKPDDVATYLYDSTKINEGEKSQNLTETVTVTADGGDVTFTNVYVRDTTNVTITKTVTGNMGDRSKQFTFEYTITDNGVVSDAQKFTLKHGGAKTISNVPVGATITVTEKNTDPYAVQVKQENETLIAFDSGESTVEVQIDKNEASIDFTNNYSVTIDTGITTDSAPYILMLALAAVGGLAYVLTRRKHA